MEALSGLELVRNWNGRSLGDCQANGICQPEAPVHEKGHVCSTARWDIRTMSTFALPLSLMLNANDSSKPVSTSCRVRKAWCGLLPVLPSCAVRTTFNDDDAESVMGEEEDTAAPATIL